MLTAHASHLSMRDDPIGHYVLGPNYLMWTMTERLGGLSLFGRGDELVVQHSLDVFDGYAVSPMAVPADFVLDGRNTSSVEPLAFARLLEAFAKRRDLLRRRVDRHAIVIRSGFAAAAVAGFFSVLGGIDRWRVFDSLPAALTWLGHPDREPEAAQIDALLQAAMAAPAELQALTEWLQQHLGEPSIEEACAALGVSKRSLQRSLADAQTSFRAQLDAVRRKEAERRLLETEDKLDAIAAELGFSSLESFSIAFRRWTGTPPGKWRAERRGAESDGK